MSERPDLAHVDVAYVADLARLALSAEEVVAFERELDDILAYVDQLREVDVSDIEPTAHAIPRVNVMREDVAVPGLPTETVLANAPAVVAEAQVRVPAVLEEASA